MSRTQWNCTLKTRNPLATVGTLLGLGLVVVSPLLLTGCGSGSGNRALTGGVVVGSNLGRAAKLIGSWKSTRTLANGKVEETTLDFAPANASESVTGSYTIRVLSPRATGGSDFLSYEAGTLTGNILTSGNLNLTFTSDGGKAVKITRADGDSEYRFDTSGRSMTNLKTSAIYTAFAALQQFIPFSIAGTWSGTPTAVGGFQLINPLTGGPITLSGSDTPLTVPISIKYETADGGLGRKYTASVTSSDTQGKSYTATNVPARLYSHYDSQVGTFPKTLTGTTSLNEDELFVSGSGVLPASAGSVSIPGVSLSIPLAGRAFVFEAGLGQDNTGSGQLGALWLKFDATKDPDLYPILMQLPNHNTDATGIYILAGYFLVIKNQSTSGGTSGGTTGEGSTSGQPSVGQILFSNAVSTNANTASITKTEAAAARSGNDLNCTLTESGSHTIVRDLVMHFYAPDDASISVGKTFQIVDSPSLAAGQARIQYIEEGGEQKYWDGTGGTIKVIAHDKDTTTFQVVNATMTPLNNYGSTSQPTGTFTINAAGKF